MNKKKIFLWTLYDFANSIAVIVFFLYFSQWLVVEHHVSDIWFNMIFVGGTVLLIITAPVAGAIADKLRVRMPFLIWTSVLFFISLLVASLTAVTSGAKTAVLIAAVAYMFANYFYQFTFNFYNPLLADLAPPEKQGKISGLGQSANWIGQITGLLITLPLASGAIYFFGQHGRAQTFLPATILFFLLALPMLIFFKEPKPSAPAPSINIKQEYKEFFRNFVNLCKVPGVGWYLLGYFFFNDAMLTAQNNMPIYLEQVFHVSDKMKSLLLVGVLLIAAVGAYVGGVLADGIGLKKSLFGILVIWAVIFPVLAVLPTFAWFAAVAVIMGFLFGATWAVTRAVMVHLSPKESLNHAFSYYTLSERFSTFAGPLTWGLITTLMVHSGPVRYRIALFSMTIFIVIGLWAVRKIPSSPRNF